MRNPDDEDCQLAFVDLVDDPIHADTNPAKTRELSFEHGARVGLFGEAIDRLDQTLTILVIELAKGLAALRLIRSR